MQIRCPHCQEPTEVGDSTSFLDITCNVCQTRFNLISDTETVSHSINGKKRVGHFQLIDIIGSGTFGSVWMARDTKLDRTVAMKIPRRGELSAWETEYFFREARAAAQLKHPGIVSVHEVGRDDKVVFIVTEYIRGANLRDWLRGNQLTPTETVEVCATVADALHHAHEHGVIHRDLKPSNILMDLDGAPHIADFGLARLETGEVTMTVQGKVLGTPAYMSPEQAKGDSHQADRRSDVFALGIVLYEMLTGEQPFRGTQQMVIVQILQEEPTSPRKLNSRVSKDLETICLKCLEKDPQKRYQTAEEMATDLRATLSGLPIAARPISRVQRGWRWAERNPGMATASFATLFLLTVVAIGSSVAAVLLGQQREYARESETKAVAALEREASARELAERNLRQARQAVDDYFTLISEDTLLDIPGLESLRKDLLQRALAYHERFIEQQQDDPDLRAEVAAAYLRMGQAYRSIALTDEAIDSTELGVSVLESLVAEGYDLSEFPSLRKGVMRVPYYRYRSPRPSSNPEKSLQIIQRAIALWTDLVDRHPNVEGFRQDLAGFHHQLGIARGVRRNPAAALETFTKASEILEELVLQRPGNARYRDQLTAAIGSVGSAVALSDPHEAIKVYAKGIELNPDNPLLYNKLAWILATHTDEQVREPQRAVQVAKKAVELEPRERNYWNTLGAAHYRNGQYQESIDALEKAIELRGDRYDWILLSMACVSNGDLTQGQRWYAKAVQTPAPYAADFERFRTEAQEVLAQQIENLQLKQTSRLESDKRAE